MYQPPRNSTRGQRCKHRCSGKLADEEQQEAHPRIFGQVTRHQFGFSHRHVERCLGQLRLHGNQENEERHTLGENVGIADNTQTENLAVCLSVDNVYHVHRARLDHHADYRQDQWEFIGDELTRRSQAT